MTPLTTGYEGRKMSVTAAVKRAYAIQGWRFVEVVGCLSSDALPAGCFTSKKARTIVALARIDGAPIKKIYSQKDQFFLVVSMQRPTGQRGEDGDVFVLVFSKQRGSPNPY